MSGDALDLDALAELEQAATPTPLTDAEQSRGIPMAGPRATGGTLLFAQRDVELIAAARERDALRSVLARVEDDRRRYHDERDAARAEVTALRELLSEATAHETEPCRLDHNGDCQEHGYHDGPCLIPRARAALTTGADQ